MKTLIYFLAFLCISFQGLAQENIDKQKEAIIEEGTMLYKLTMADKLAADLFAKQYKGKEKNYLSLSHWTNNQITYLFYTTAEKPKAIGSITFNETADKDAAKVVIADRELLVAEKDLIAMKKSAVQLIATDELFEGDIRNNAIIIPLLYKGVRKVYVLPRQQQEGMVVFGNDYLITLDNSNAISEKKKIHPNSANVKYRSSNTNDAEPMKEMHNHYPQTGDILSVTDVCTLMLYQKAANWKQHTVISETYISIWNCDANQMITIQKGVRGPKE